METPRQRWWDKAMDALYLAQDNNQPDAYRAAQAGIANAYLQMVHLTFLSDEEEKKTPPEKMQPPMWAGENEA